MNVEKDITEIIAKVRTCVEDGEWKFAEGSDGLATRRKKRTEWTK